MAQLVALKFGTWEVPGSNLQHQFSVRGDMFKVTKTNKRKVGNNIMVNRMATLNDQIPLNWLSLSYESFKLKSKGRFLKW